jgi:hypothetical protein
MRKNGIKPLFGVRANPDNGLASCSDYHICRAARIEKTAPCGLMYPSENVSRKGAKNIGFALEVIQSSRRWTVKRDISFA